MQNDHKHSKGYIFYEEKPESANKSRLFHAKHKENKGVTQNVHVEINIDQKDDCLSACFSGLAKCFGKSSAGS